MTKQVGPREVLEFWQCSRCGRRDLNYHEEVESVLVPTLDVEHKVLKTDWRLRHKTDKGFLKPLRHWDMGRYKNGRRLKHVETDKFR